MKAVTFSRTLFQTTIHLQTRKVYYVTTGLQNGAVIITVTITDAILNNCDWYDNDNNHYHFIIGIICIIIFYYRYAIADS